jgi:3-phosphoshikimate 1-carboxyvinyltransferase
MPLPDLIEIVPLAKPVRAEITVPGSKSITNRALILAALAKGRTTLTGALWSEDTQIMADGLRHLGFPVEVTPDPEEFCNRTITVHGSGGKIPRVGTAAKPLELFVGNAGTAARFLAALVCLGRGVYRLHGAARMHERPQAALFQALRELGYQIESTNDKLPALIHGVGPRAGKCRVSIEESSQFASALLLCGSVGGWNVEVTGENAEESPYVAMTVQLIEKFQDCGGSFQIEPDASSGSYFWAATCLLPSPLWQLGDSLLLNASDFSFLIEKGPHSIVTVADWPRSHWQVDQGFLRFLSRPSDVSRRSDLGDSIMTAIVLAPLAAQPIRFKDLERLRVQECERVVALRTELTRCGAKIIETGDTLEVFPSKLHGAEIETYNDHRLAMCFAILGLKVPGIKIRHPACAKKTFPNFFQKLAAPPPAGLGATILDAASGKKQEVEELFAV